MSRTSRIAENEADVYRAIVNSVLRSGSDGLIEISRFLHREAGENTFFLMTNSKRYSVTAISRKTKKV
jgi:hypothetical protein